MVDKKRKDHADETDKTDDRVTESSVSVKRVGVQSGEKLSFNQHLNVTTEHLYESTCNQLIAIISPRNFLNFDAKSILINCYFYLNTDSCPLF